MALVSFARRLRDILESPLPIDPETRELQPRTLQLTPEARTVHTRRQPVRADLMTLGGVTADSSLC